jgi:hypothetical protein
MNELAACPFAQCRGLAKLIEIEIDDFDQREHRVWRVICGKCGAQGPIGGRGDRGRERAQELWDSRVTT